MGQPPIPLKNEFETKNKIKNPIFKKIKSFSYPYLMRTEPKNTFFK